MTVCEHDVVVLGAGPAGSAVATLLARLGHDVGIVRPARPPAGALTESIPPSARRLLEELGVLTALEQAGFQPNRGNTVWWAGGEARIEVFDSGDSGFHVDRTGLERVLVAETRRAGAIVHGGSSARSVSWQEGGWVIRCSESGRGGTTTLAARWVVDATGRRGLIATREGRETEPGTRTTALVRRWRRSGGFRDVDPTHTLIESYGDGWAWSVPLPDDTRCVTAMVDHCDSALAGADLDSNLDAELDKTRHVGGLRSGAEPCGPTWACPASLYAARRFGRPGLLLVGDAGSFIDPLSSFGVKKALSSGWLASVVIHTALVDEPMLDVAVEFFDRREREVYATYRARSADFFEEGARAYGHPYWIRRAEAARRAGSDASVQVGPPDPEPDVPGAAPMPRTEVQEAFEILRGRERLEAARGSTLRMLSAPAIVGHRIRLEEQLASDRLPGGLRYVRGVDLRRVVEVAPSYDSVPDGWVAYNDGAPPVALPDYLTALSVAFAGGLLEHQEEGSGRSSGEG